MIKWLKIYLIKRYLMDMRIYPHIAYYYGSERYSNGTVIKEGFYVCTDTENGRTIVPLEKWLKK